MSRKAKDLTGLKAGRLTVLRRSGTKNKQAVWECICDCGNVCITHSSALRSENISCGCLRKENSSRMMTKMSIKHGESGTRLYSCWREMRCRCNTPSAKSYVDYGGRGIKVCDEWETSFENFKEWSMKNGYTDALTLDRRDNNQSYCPENCRWVGWDIQNNNRRSSRMITHNAKTQSATQWARELGISKATFYSRIRAGKPIDELMLPVKNASGHENNDRTKS